MQISKSNIFSGNEEPSPRKLSLPIIVSLIGKADYDEIALMSSDSILVEQRDSRYTHYLNGEFNTNCNTFSSFDIDILNTNRVLINVVDFKEAVKVYDSYELTGTEEAMRDYLEINKVLNVVVLNTQINLPDNNVSLALDMSWYYRFVSEGASIALLTDAEDIPDAISSVLNTVDNYSLENVFIYRNNSLVALKVSNRDGKVLLDSIRIIDL